MKDLLHFGDNQWVKLGKRVYRKEILPVGQYRKDADDLDFEISMDTLKHVGEVTNGMIKEGIKIPLVKNHDGDSAFGHVLNFSVDEDKGTSFVDVEFMDDDCCKEAVRNGVSAFIPPEFVDGKGNAWKRPLRHVAITPYPVIHGMGEWDQIAACFQPPTTKPPKKRSTKMLDSLSKTLALSFEDGQSQEDREAVVVSAVETLAEQAIELSEQLSQYKKRERKPAKKLESLEYPDSVVLSFGKSRTREIQDLVEKNKITSAVGKALTKKYCNSDAVSLALSQGTTDDFDSLVEIMQLNASVPNEGKKEMAYKLSHDNDEVSPLVKAAQERAARAAS